MYQDMGWRTHFLHMAANYHLNRERLNRLINRALLLKYDYNIIVGDFNYPSINWEDMSISDSKTHASFHFIECVRDNYLTQFTNQPTRYRDGQTSNILDQLLIDKEEIVENMSYGTSLGASDHISFSVELNCNIKYVQSKTVKRNYYKANYIAARNKLSQVNWEEMKGMNVHGSWEFFLNKLTCIERHVPIAKATKWKKASWMDEYCFK